MSAYYNQIRSMLAEKIPHAVAEMAHYHAIKDMELPKQQEEAGLKMFCFVECLKPSTPHPIDPAFYSAGYDIEIGHGNKARLWMREDGELTEDESECAKVSPHWDRDCQGRAYHRNRACAGFEKAKAIIRSLGVPKSIRIYDNIP